MTPYQESVLYRMWLTSWRWAWECIGWEYARRHCVR